MKINYNNAFVSDFTQGLCINQKINSSYFVTKYYITNTIIFKHEIQINQYIFIDILDSRTHARTMNNTTSTKIDTQHLNLRHVHENYVMHSRQCTHGGIFYVSPSSNFAVYRVLPPRSCEIVLTQHELRK